MASDLLEGKTDDSQYSENIKKLDEISFLSKKSIRSNMNSPRCIYYKCKEYKNEVNCQEGESLPFKILLEPLESSDYEKQEGNKDAIRISLNLVRLFNKLGTNCCRFIRKNSDLFQCLFRNRGGKNSLCSNWKTFLRPPKLF